MTAVSSVGDGDNVGVGDGAVWPLARTTAASQMLTTIVTIEFGKRREAASDRRIFIFIQVFSQLGESDLYAQPFGKVAGPIAQLSFFLLRRSFFAGPMQKSGDHRPPLQRSSRMRWTGQIFWLLA